MLCACALEVRWFAYNVVRKSGKQVASGELCLHCGLALETWPLQKLEDKVARLKAGEDVEFRKDLSTCRESRVV